MNRDRQSPTKVSSSSPDDVSDEDRNPERVIVVDLGSGTLKAGLCGEDAPRAVLDAVVGTGPGRGEAAPEILAGDEAMAAKDRLNMTRPIRRGRCVDWDALETLLRWTFEEELGADPERDGLPVLIADSPGTSISDREAVAKMLFEKFKVKGCAMTSQAVLSLFAGGRTTGLVAECGGEVTSTTPVFEGYALAHGVRRRDFGGADVDALVLKTLKTVSSTTVARAIKERFARARPTPDEEDGEYALPDGAIVTIPRAAASAWGDAIFTGPSGLANLARESLERCDRELRETLRKSTVPSGGTSRTTGFCARLADELDDGPPPHAPSDHQRTFGAWIGGSMLASFSAFRELEITKQEYDDNRGAAVRRKCF